MGCGRRLGGGGPSRCGFRRGGCGWRIWGVEVKRVLMLLGAGVRGAQPMLLAWRWGGEFGRWWGGTWVGGRGEP